MTASDKQPIFKQKREEKIRMKQYLLAAFALAATSAWAADSLSVEVLYGGPVGGTSSSGIYTAIPDTSIVIIENTGTTDFTGLLSLTGFSGIGVYGHIVVDDNNLFGPVTDGVLSPGETWTLYGGDEASNYGGYNKCQAVVPPLFGQDPTGDPDSGMLLHIAGTLGATPIDYSIYDYEIHSGTSAVNPFGFSLDNYILQGGDPFGRDTGDAFEESQAHALLSVTGSRSASPLPCTVPDSGSAALLFASGITAMAFLRRKLGA
jgi:hypothetical protein